MTHDYSQYDDNDNVEFNHRAVCNAPDCDWENRRRSEWSINNSKKSHERKTGHSVEIENIENISDDGE
jgi:hypothetical protein